MCAATIADAQSELNEKDRLSKSGANTAKLSRSVRQKIDQIHGDLASLASTLAEIEKKPSDYRIGEGEVNRRRGMLTRLRNSYATVQGNASGENSAKRAGLYGDDRYSLKVLCQSLVSNWN